MNASLEILNEQIENLKENYYLLLGGCQNILEFSNYTVMDKRYIDKTKFNQYKEINIKLKKLFLYMNDLKEKIKEI